MEPEPELEPEPEPELEPEIDDDVESNNLTVAELKATAKEKGIASYSNITKK